MLSISKFQGSTFKRYPDSDRDLTTLNKANIISHLEYYNSFLFDLLDSTSTLLKTVLKTLARTTVLNHKAVCVTTLRQALQEFPISL